MHKKNEIAKLVKEASIGITSYESTMTKIYEILDAPIEIDRDSLLPEHYEPVDEPFYEGKGNHNVPQLESICEAYKERCHQQQIVKQNILLKTNAKIIIKDYTCQE